METALHNSSLRIEFNPKSIKEIDEAKRKYIQARKEGRSVLHPDTREPLGSFPSDLGGFIIDDTNTKAGDFAIHFIDGSGDQRIIWDIRDKQQLKEAKKKFDEYVAKGWKPYAINRDGKRGRRIFSFDDKAEEIVFEDKTTREKLANFSTKFKEVKMLPRTYPG